MRWILLAIFLVGCADANFEKCHELAERAIVVSEECHEKLQECQVAFAEHLE